MKFPLSWLKTHLETEASLDEILACLNTIGLEVEGVEDKARALASFRIARVVEATQHPNADRLRALTVDAGDGKFLSVVCGAPNARTGLVGVLAMPGDTIPATGTVLKVGEIRGVKSEGMMCSARELGLGEDHSGIIDCRRMRRSAQATPPGPAWTTRSSRSASRPTAATRFPCMAWRATWPRPGWAG